MEALKATNVKKTSRHPSRFWTIDTFCQYLKSPLRTSTSVSHNSAIGDPNDPFD